MQHAILAQAERQPERTALVCRNERQSYGALAQHSAQLAHQLRAIGCIEGDRVGILIHKSIEAIDAILGTLQAGCIYVPMDPQSPAARLAKIVQACTPRCVLVTRETLALGQQIGASAVGVLGASSNRLGATAGAAGSVETSCAFTQSDLTAQTTTPPAITTKTENAAHILFTSGSTGTPKGVVIPHRSVLAFLDWAVPHFGIDAQDRCSAHPPLHFDLSTFDIYGTLGQGAELHLVPSELGFLPHKLAEFIRSSRLTQWFSVPSILTYMIKFGVVRQNDFAELERVLWCGEVLPTPTLIELMRLLPRAHFTNLYGPTEATIASTYYDVPAIPDDPQQPIPIGKPCGGEEALVLDDQMQALTDGEIGNLYLAGIGLSPGYWQDPDETKAAFVLDPRDPTRRIYKTGDLARGDRDGLLHFVGRKDTQIKSRGYRIELGEIEAALHTLPSLRESAVVAVPTDGFENWTICCGFSAYEGQNVTGAQVREALRSLVPSYMLPMRWLFLLELPKNQNGKIDRPRLRQMFEQTVSG